MSEREARPRLVPFRRSRHTPDAARLAEFGATARKLQAERELAAEQVERMLRETPRARWPRLAEEESLRTSGALEQLSEAVEVHLDQDPCEALLIAELATQLSQTITGYPAILLAQMRAHALMDLAQALCYLSRYEEALEALDDAEAKIGPFGALSHDGAVMRLVRATVLQHLRRFDEASELLKESCAVFEAHSDHVRYVKCTLALGNLMVRRGDYRAALTMLGPFLGNGDPHTRAIVSLTVGWCSLELAQLDNALACFSDAENLFGRLGRQLSALKASYGVGSALLRLGRVDEAIARLQRTRAQFLAENLIEEAGLSGLEIVEACLLRNDIDDARQLASKLVQEFSEAGLNRRAIAALAYLKEVIVASNATPDVARDVHAYILALQIDPTREFACIN
jgi:tetratricopeptide (TPR) repeat protein